jgi:hypothetical protein
MGESGGVAGKVFRPEDHVGTVDGKPYMYVRWRLVWLRHRYPDAVVDTELRSDDGEEAVFRAKVTVPAGGSATGWGSETRRDFKDFREKAESKALGRALAALGFGAEFCEDFDAVAGAIEAQPSRPAPHRPAPPRAPAQRPAPPPRPAPLTPPPVDDAFHAFDVDAPPIAQGATGAAPTITLGGHVIALPEADTSGSVSAGQLRNIAALMARMELDPSVLSDAPERLTYTQAGRVIALLNEHGRASA